VNLQDSGTDASLYALSGTAGETAHTVTIAANGPRMTITAEAMTIAEDASDRVVTLTATLVRDGVTEEVTVTFDVDTASTATAATDYTEIAGDSMALTFASSETVKTFDVTVLNDNLIETERTETIVFDITATMGAAGSPVILLDNGGNLLDELTLSITDDDFLTVELLQRGATEVDAFYDTPPGAIALYQACETDADESQFRGMFLVSGGQLEEAVTIQVVLQPAGGSFQPATIGVDISLPDPSYDIPAGRYSTATVLPSPPYNTAMDGVDDSFEGVALVIDDSVVDARVMLGARRRAVITIIESDRPGCGPGR